MILRQLKCAMENDLNGLKDKPDDLYDDYGDSFRMMDMPQTL